LGRPALLPPPAAFSTETVPAAIRVRGACTSSSDPDLFFIEENPSVALALCAICPVRAACLSYAVDNEQYGVWGGTVASQRQEMRGGPLRHSVEQRRHADLIRSRIKAGWVLEDVADAEAVNERTLKRWREHPDQPTAA
jgi:WhiB family redox-sensing transcriptional regulator